jgi:hypothetical protein
VPDVDAGARDRGAGSSFDDAQAKRQRHARLAFRDIGAHHLGIEIIRPFFRLRRDDASILRADGRALRCGLRARILQQACGARGRKREEAAPGGGQDRLGHARLRSS